MRDMSHAFEYPVGVSGDVAVTENPYSSLAIAMEAEWGFGVSAS